MLEEEGDEEKVLFIQVKKFLMKDIHRTFEELGINLISMSHMWERNYVDSSVQSNKIKGKATIEKNCITNASFELKLQNSLRTVALELAGIHTLSQLERALWGIHRLEARVKRLKHPNVESLAIATQILHSYVDLLNEVCTELRIIGRLLRLPNPSSFPNSIRLEQVFSPELPKDIVAEFSIHQTQMVLDVYVIALTSKPLDTITPTMHGRDLVRKVIQYQEYRVQVLDYCSVGIVLPVFDDILSVLDETLALCVHIRENATALLKVQRFG